MSPDLYNPLAIDNLGKSLTEAFLERLLQPFPTHTFNGSGIYGLYYLPHEKGHELYRREARGKHPIYIGKATTQDSSNSLYQRLSDHRKSIEAANSSLRVEDFQCRYLLVEDVWTPLGEQLLIDKFTPIWNKKIRGFGNKSLGKERVSQIPSPWDLLHPGRQRSTNPGKENALTELRIKLDKYLETLSDED